MEAKLTTGIGKSEDYLSLVSSIESFAKTAEINFLPQNKSSFEVDEEISLKLSIKNVPKLTIQVFEINTTFWYKQNKRAVPADINLDGLVANYEEKHDFSAVPPIQRKVHEFRFPNLPKRGVFAFEVIGGGKSSRAVIHKGGFRLVDRVCASGHMLLVFDEKNNHVNKDCELWMDGHSYLADKDGEYRIPFTTYPTQQNVVITYQGVSSLASFYHQKENYSLKAGFYVDREQLLKSKKALLLVRPSLLISENLAPLSILENVKLTIHSEDQDGCPSQKEIPNFPLFAEKDSTYELAVPENTRLFRFTLEASVKMMSDRSTLTLSDSHAVTLNGIDTSLQFVKEFLHLSEDGYRLYVLGNFECFFSFHIFQLFQLLVFYLFG